MEAMQALDHLDYQDSLRRGAQAILDDQRPDGSWWTGTSPSWLETAYSVMALRTLVAMMNIWVNRAVLALAQAEERLYAMRPDFTAYETRWLGKEVYAPERVDRAYLLSTIVAAEATAPDSSVALSRNML